MARKRFLLIMMFISLFIIASDSALSIGLRTGDIPRYIVAKPFGEHSFTFIADGFGRDVRPYFIADPDLEGYVSLSEAKVVGPSLKEFTVTIRFPENITAEPGMREILVGAEEMIDEGKGIVPKTKVQYRVNIYILYPEKYIDAHFSTQNVNENETADFGVEVSNFGVPDIKVLMVTVDIFNSTNDRIKQAESGLHSLKSGETDVIHVQLDTTGMKAGTYNATANVYYDGSELPLDGSFRIGHMKVRVVNYTQAIFAEKINRFDVEVENEWNGKIDSILADITIATPSRNLTARTTTESMGMLSKMILTGFVDADGIEPGEYPVKIELFYEKDKSVHRGTVQILKPSILAAAGNLWLGIGIAVLVLIIILTIINVIILLKRKK